jgi:DNA-binding response OmpR family regulator
MAAPDKPISDSAQATAILVVEDEFLVRMFTVDALEDAGFRVIQAGTAAEAMAALRGTTGFGAALVDIGLPDRPGDQLAEEIHALRADLPIVIASGRSSRELRDRFAGSPRIAILGKPYTAPLLLEVLAEMGVAASPSDCGSTRPADSAV